MRGVLVACVSYKGVSRETQLAIQPLLAAGAKLVATVGTADVALARNLLLTMCHERYLSAGESLDTLLLVDDDMVFTLDQAERLVDGARRDGLAHSACYATNRGDLAATPLNWDWSDRSRWMVGLGFCAMPCAALARLVHVARPVVGPDGKKIFPFCQSRTLGDRWCSEDYWLCHRLGGVILEPIGVGHTKPIALYPDDETLRRIAEGEPLEGAPIPPTAGGDSPLNGKQTPHVLTQEP